jgi:hypothetical protein
MTATAADIRDTAPEPALSRPIHPLWVRLTHWINALAMLVMIGSGWQIYNASPLFSFDFPPQITPVAGSPEASVALCGDVGACDQWAALRGARSDHRPLSA